jgi:hypothetical protein
MEKRGRRGLTGEHSTKAEMLQPPLHPVCGVHHLSLLFSAVHRHYHPPRLPQFPLGLAAASASEMELHLCLFSTRASHQPHCRLSRHLRCSPRPAKFGSLRICFSAISRRFSVLFGRLALSKCGAARNHRRVKFKSSDGTADRC